MMKKKWKRFHGVIVVTIPFLVLGLLTIMFVILTDLKDCTLINKYKVHRNITDWKSSDEWLGTRIWEVDHNEQIEDGTYWITDEETVDEFLDQYDLGHSEQCLIGTQKKTAQPKPFFGDDMDDLLLTYGALTYGLGWLVGSFFIEFLYFLFVIELYPLWEEDEESLSTQNNIEEASEEGSYDYDLPNERPPHSTSSSSSFLSFSDLESSCSYSYSSIE